MPAVSRRTEKDLAAGLAHASKLADEPKEMRDLRLALTRTQSQLTRAKDKNALMLAAVKQGAHDAILGAGPPPPVEPPEPDSRRAAAETAVWHMTDWQGAKITSSYNTRVMHKRVLRFCDKAELITNIQRADHPVRNCMILFGGDMLEGLFNYPTQLAEVDATLFAQYADVGRLCAQVVRRALAVYEKVEVVAEWGNHGRIGRKNDGVPRADNLDRMAYELGRMILLEGDQESAKRLKWEDSAEDIQRVQVGNYRALLIHGDEIGRNGFASPTTLLKAANNWASGAYPWDFRDVYIGHYHTHNEWAMANGLGTVFQTGSTESDNRYARETMASSAIPSQRLHFVDPKRGRVTAQYKVYVDD